LKLNFKLSTKSHLIRVSHLTRHSLIKKRRASVPKLAVLPKVNTITGTQVSLWLKSSRRDTI